MNSNIKPSDRAVLLDTIDADAYAPVTLTTAWCSAKDFANFMAVISWGDLGISDTINAKLQQSTNTSPMATAKNVTGKAITEVDSTDSPIPHNKQAIINCRADELDVANDYDLVRLSVTIASTSSPLGTLDLHACIFGFDAAYAPETDDTSVVEVV